MDIENVTTVKLDTEFWPPTVGWMDMEKLATFKSEQQQNWSLAKLATPK